MNYPIGTEIQRVTMERVVDPYGHGSYWRVIATVKTERIGARFDTYCSDELATDEAFGVLSACVWRGTPPPWLTSVPKLAARALEFEGLTRVIP